MSTFTELRSKRETLYLSFDKTKSPGDFYLLQKLLADAIWESEVNIKAKIEVYDWQFHLDRLYSLGDAIAYTLLNPFVIRQLGQYQSVRTSLIGQQDNFRKLIDSYEQRAADSVYLFADLTRCITHGDIIEIHSPDDIDIIESKGVRESVPTVDDLLSGRNGRQFSKTFWLKRFLDSGFELLYGKEKPTMTVEVDVEISYHYNIVPSLIDDCLVHGKALVQAEPGLFYMASDLSKETGDFSFEQLKQVKQPVFAGTGRLVENDTDTAYHIPALAMPFPINSKILLQEVDINILGILDIKYLAEIAEKKGYELSYDQKNGTINIRKDSLSFDFHTRFLNDILINFKTVNSVVSNLIALFDTVSLKNSLSPEEEEHLKKRPKNREEFKAYLEDNFVVAKMDEKGFVVEAFDMNGVRIFKLK